MCYAGEGVRKVMGSERACSVYRVRFIKVTSDRWRAANKPTRNAKSKIRKRNREKMAGRVRIIMVECCAPVGYASSDVCDGEVCSAGMGWMEG